MVSKWVKVNLLLCCVMLKLIMSKDDKLTACRTVFGVAGPLRWRWLCSVGLLLCPSLEISYSKSTFVKVYFSRFVFCFNGVIWHRLCWNCRKILITNWVLSEFDTAFSQCAHCLVFSLLVVTEVTVVTMDICKDWFLVSDSAAVILWKYLKIAGMAFVSRPYAVSDQVVLKNWWLCSWHLTGRF